MTFLISVTEGQIIWGLGVCFILFSTIYYACTRDPTTGKTKQEDKILILVFLGAGLLTLLAGINIDYNFIVFKVVKE